MQKRMSNFAVTVHGIINPRQTTFTTMAEHTQTMPDYIGTVLTNGAFLKMHQSYRDLIEKSNPANMKCDALLATYKAALKKMALFVGSEQGFIETADLQVLDQDYRVAVVQPVDMFPHTPHVENVVLLLRR